ncbi:hypothetical protein SAMN05421810_11395 [Amycolatopsis arida]|uniref:Uncharacterized protein n=1 Tax=Amycolatopsis arida TaxID=587909 RepID=A0A1I6AMN4_9PSEU|nr:hypothetical protein CLV69_11395 [Amycolatopsis arida]SFQ69955.1 hypothetical protein SAMN05421810_11395 [Amycolatopsis arida]
MPRATEAPRTNGPPRWPPGGVSEVNPSSAWATARVTSSASVSWGAARCGPARRLVIDLDAAARHSRAETCMPRPAGSPRRTASAPRGSPRRRSCRLVRGCRTGTAPDRASGHGHLPFGVVAVADHQPTAVLVNLVSWLRRCRRRPRPATPQPASALSSRGRSSSKGCPETMPRPVRADPTGRADLTDGRPERDNAVRRACSRNGLCDHGGVLGEDCVRGVNHEVRALTDSAARPATPRLHCQHAHPAPVGSSWTAPFAGTE